MSDPRVKLRDKLTGTHNISAMLNVPWASPVLTLDELTMLIDLLESATKPEPPHAD